MEIRPNDNFNGVEGLRFLFDSQTHPQAKTGAKMITVKGGTDCSQLVGIVKPNKAMSV